MDLEYRNREPLDPEKEDFAKRVAQDLELDTEKIIIYPSEPAGIYIGRENQEYPIIGLRNDERHVLAHELGHDRHAQIEDRTWEAEPKLNSEGALTSPNDEKEDLDEITDEIYAELVSSEYTLLGFERSPLDHAHKYLRGFTDRIILDQREAFEAIEQGTAGREYFTEPEDPEELEKTSEAMRELLEEDEEDFKDILYNTWSQKIHKCVVKGENDKIWRSIDNFLDIPYGEQNWHQISSKYGEEVRETIEDNYGNIGFEILRNLNTQLARISVEEGSATQHFDDNLPNPSHFSPKVASEEAINGFNNDFSHQIGNYASRVLNRHLGITHGELERLDREKVEEFAYHFLELSIEMGKNEDYYDIMDFEQGIEHLAKEHLIDDKAVDLLDSQRLTFQE